MELFQPSLSLILQRNGRYTLRSVTLTPNSCYYAGKAEIGVPPNVRVLPEVLPVMLHINRRGGICLQVITPVNHMLRNLKLGPEHGKTTVTAFAMLDGMVVGTSSIDVKEPAVQLEAEGSAEAAKEYGKGGPICPFDTRDWYAWVDLMPPGPKSFHVVGSVLAPTPGYKASMKPAVPQGINPKQLILELELVPLPGNWPQVLTWIEARYDQESFDGDYDEVAIRCGGEILAVVPVEEVQ
jgi:hypothetical protein